MKFYACYFLLLFGAAVSGSAQDSPALTAYKTMDERNVPVPAEVSEELRAFIAKKKISPPMPVPNNSTQPMLCYGGSWTGQRSEVKVLPWHEVVQMNTRP